MQITFSNKAMVKTLGLYIRGSYNFGRTYHRGVVKDRQKYKNSGISIMFYFFTITLCN